MLRGLGLGAIAKLLVSVDADTKGLERSLDSAEDKVKSFAGRLESSIDTQAFRTVGTAITGIGLALVGVLSVTGLYAARVEVLGTSLRVVGETAGYSTSYLAEQEEKIKDLGITTKAAREIMILLIQSEIDLAEATDLSRIAQDLAVISGENSSETARNLAYAVATGNPMLLRRYGIMQNLGDIQAKYGKELTETQKKQAILNMIQEKGATVAGVYETAMEDVGKQLTSLPRLIDDFKLAFGDAFIPVIGLGVTALTELLELYLDLSPAIRTVITWVTTLVAAFALILGPILLVIGYLPKIAGGWALIKGVAIPAIAWIIGGLESLYIALLMIPEPITKIIAAIIGLILAGILIWKNWDKIKDFLIEVWVNLGAAMIKDWENIKINAARIWENIEAESTKIWNSISDFFIGIWEEIKEIFINATDFIKGLFIGSVWEEIKTKTITVWDSIIAYLVSLWGTIKSIFTVSLAFITNLISMVFNFIKDSIIMPIWNGVVSFFTTIWNNIVTTVNSFKYSFLRVWDYIKDGMKSQLNEIIGLLSLSSIWNSLVAGVNNFKNTFLGAWSGIKEGVRSALNGIIQVINSFIWNFQSSINSIIRSLNTIAGTYIGQVYIPTIPGLQLGGHITKGGFVDVGERGRERIFLPKGAEVRPLEKGVATTPEIHLHLEYNEELTSKTFARLFAQRVGAINK